MTRKRNDSHSTEFGLWLREHPEIDSHLGFVATNIDFMWQNYKTGDWMLIEEKRHGSHITFPQRKMFEVIHAACTNDPRYKGIHLLVFENTSPDDGKIFLDTKPITRPELLEFLRTFKTSKGGA